MPMAAPKLLSIYDDDKLREEVQKGSNRKQMRNGVDGEKKKGEQTVKEQQRRRRLVLVLYSLHTK